MSRDAVRTMTPHQMEEYRRELRELKDRLTAIATELTDLRSSNRADSDTIVARLQEERILAEHRRMEVEGFLSHPEIVDGVGAECIEVGSKVTFRFDGKEPVTLTLVSCGRPDSGVLGIETPLAQALLGRKAGETVTYKAPGGLRSAAIEKVE